ncbi:MAG: GNAT family N-acetyltransferase [Casimicrobiaceae bacterium]
MKARPARAKPWLETLRIEMRAFHPDDFDDLLTLDSDPRVMRFFSGGKPSPRPMVEAAMRRILRYSALYPDLGFWHASRRDTGEFIGWFCFKYAGRSPDIEVGYRLMHRAWGQGFATEGATALVRFGLDDLGLHRIIGVTHKDNVASQRVLMKAGLRDRGWARYYDQRLRLFAVTRDEDTQ